MQPEMPQNLVTCVCSSLRRNVYLLLFFFAPFLWCCRLPHSEQSLDLLCVVDLRFVVIETERSTALGQLDANRNDYITVD